MSAHKIIKRRRVILDLSNKELNYNSIYNKLNKLTINAYSICEGTLSSVANVIKIGSYYIRIKDSAKTNKSPKVRSLKKLKNIAINDNLSVDIMTKCSEGIRPIKIGLIEDECWKSNYMKHCVSIKDLSNMIIFCKRLDQLTSFS